MVIWMWVYPFNILGFQEPCLSGMNIANGKHLSCRIAILIIGFNQPFSSFTVWSHIDYCWVQVSVERKLMDL